MRFGTREPVLLSGVNFTGMPARKPAPEPPESVRRLAAVMPVTWRSMFGGLGVYCEGIFFALVSSESRELYFRVSDETRPDYEKSGSRPFQPFSRVKSRMHMRITMPYWLVPGKVLARPATLRRWAEAALEAARTKRAKTEKKIQRKREARE